MRFRSMFAQLFLSITILGTVLLGGLLYNNLSSAREALYEQKSEDMRLHTDRTGQYLDLYLQHITEVLFSTSRMTELLEMDPVRAGALLKQVKQTSSSLIGSLFIITADERILSSDQFLYDIVGHPQLAKLVHIATDNYGGVNWSEPYYSPIQVGQTVAFSLPMKDRGGQTAGVIILEVDMELLTRKISSFMLQTGQSFAVLTGQGNVVAFDQSGELDIYRNQKNPYHLHDAVVAQLIDMPTGLKRMQAASLHLMVIKNRQNQLGWYVISMTDEAIFHQKMNELVWDALRFSSLWFVLLLVLTYVLSRSFTRPIKRLALQMDRIDDERLRLKIRPLERKDEIGRLSRSFSYLMQRIHHLLEERQAMEARRRKNELKMLLSQIRPHFLYNTLVCIGSLAKQNRAREVDETIRSLILLLTFSIDKKEELISLREELMVLEAFVQIQKVRYGDTFTFTMLVDPQLPDCRVPKLVLQPLVENAIFHGLSEREQGRIEVLAEVVADGLQLAVKDNGRGMPEELMQVINNQAHSGVLPNKKKGLNSIGIHNIKERMQLLYGPAYGVTIRARAGGGTETLLKLPLNKSEDR
ncbi:sensor histidine kinase [Paenibacillus sp. IB182496]|uniref:Sensor histidine kinase n=1 Tax=Paenibacillus sabuli TaxID=2772509 RepID=A0A927GQ43_9BACL|nr:sensor histidine kinase [Paenibacillus sabuli]MBD2843978.1 sensor histidine kinase [Paenibacillus sabuli]